MSRRLGPTTTRYYHHSGPHREHDEDDVTFDYDYYETYEDYTKSRAAREPRSQAVGGSGSSDEDRYVRRRREGPHDDPRATRSRDINLHSPRLAAAAAGSYFSARNGNSRRDDREIRDDLASRKPRSMPGEVTKAAPPSYTTPRGRPPLPSGWVPMFSATHGRWYYVNKDSGKPQWEAPGFEVKKVQKELRERERELKSKERDSQRSLAPRDSSPSGRSQSRHSRHGSGLSITGMLLGAAGGIAAGTLVAKSLKKDKSDRSIKRRGSRSDTSSAGDRRRDRDRDGRRNDRDDFEEDNVPSYHHGHGDSHSPGHSGAYSGGHGFGGHGHGHGHGGSDDDDDD
ncbi:hypothetical protein Sste5346_003845 [Sporothrix stenoceras]|uniref:WW domain-containing protein n=1 Tax=Sporothrix stenoceras TaxID=5173 RepID=A0ABR3ZCC3_9PEZI